MAFWSDAVNTRLLAACSPGEVRVAVSDGVLLDYALHRPGEPDGVGDLHVGRVTAHLGAMGGAFVQIGAASGFLPDSEGTTSEGDLVAVRVIRAAQGGKGPRLSSRLDDAERERVALHGMAEGLVARGPDPMRRLAASWPDATLACDDAAIAAILQADCGRPVQVVARAFDDPLESEIESLAQSELALPGGLRASIHPTPALVAIDVDMAAASAERRPKQVAQFAGNRAAIPALLHQVRLRNLSGAILIDLAGLSTRKRRALAPTIEAALARDPLRPRLLGFTALGLAEILRPRVHPALHELLQTPLGAGLAGLRAALSAHQPGQRPILRAGIAVATALRADTRALAAFAQAAAAPISLRMEPTLPALCWTIDHE
ncbi:ribonuclease E/G [Lichenicoccus sp.]|uniref:ribonuclease E/G n=1 Tax=Lichenicoccus sp. TaxID=2781899 RepID=UPI003D125AA1